MHSKYYKFFDTVIRVITPEPVADAEPYSQFICDECNADYTVEFEYSDCLPHIPQNSVWGDNIVLFSEGGIYYRWYKNHGMERVYACRIFSPERRRVILLSEFKGKLWNRVIFDLLGFEEIMAEKKKAVIHSSYIVKNGKAVLFTAPSGTGKSTQASLWEKYADATVVNGDKSLIFESDGIGYACGLPFSGSSGICKNVTAPLCAIVYLAQSKENKLIKLSVAEAVVSVIKGCYLPVENSAVSGLVIDSVSEICKSVPVYRLECLPDESSVRILEKELCL